MSGGYGSDRSFGSNDRFFIAGLGNLKQFLKRRQCRPSTFRMPSWNMLTISCRSDSMRKAASEMDYPIIISSNWSVICSISMMAMRPLMLCRRIPCRDSPYSACGW